MDDVLHDAFLLILPYAPRMDIVSASSGFVAPAILRTFEIAPLPFVHKHKYAFILGAIGFTGKVFIKAIKKRFVF